MSSTMITTSVTTSVVSRGAARRTAADRAPTIARLRRAAASFTTSASSRGTVVTRAKESDEETEAKESKEGSWDVGGFFGEAEFDGNAGPFLRPEGSPFFASYTDPTVVRGLHSCRIQKSEKQSADAILDTSLRQVRHTFHSTLEPEMRIV
jgi:hypothetical protein